MMEIENWMKQYCGAVRAAFGDRVRYIGLQGSRGRGEAGPDSDIDVVCILDSCSLQDLETYRAAVKDLPDRDKLCGFVSGTAELAAWDRGELFQLRLAEPILPRSMCLITPTKFPMPLAAKRLIEEELRTETGDSIQL